MFIQFQEVPLVNVTEHAYYNEELVMYVVVGHSAALGYILDEQLNVEISRGLWWFMGGLLVIVFVCFIIFSWVLMCGL